MVAEKKFEVCKDGSRCELRSPTLDDAEAMMDLLRNFSETTDYMLVYPEECVDSAETERKILGAILENPKQVFIGCFIGSQMVGNIGVYPVGVRQKLAHRCQIGIGVRDTHRGNGVGTLLLQYAIEWAKRIGYEQMELDVVSENHAGIRLYERFGFRKVGQIPHGIKRRQGGYYALDFMVLDLQKNIK